jgi:ABC-2 type transport system ATP-binding protein
LGVIRVAGLVKRYGDRTAVDDLHFEVGAGEILGLVGPNGAGKTTTLRTLAGILSPTQGEVWIADRDLARDPLGAKQRLALVPDEPSLFQSLTVWEHLELSAQIYGVPDFEPRARSLLEEFELSERSDSFASELSRGMQQKLAVAGALLHEPDALLLDEPLSGLDPRGIRSFYATVERRAEAGAAVVLSSHLLGQIESLCTRFLILHNGRCLFNGSKGEIAAQLPALQGDASLEEIFFAATTAEPTEATTAPTTTATPVATTRPVNEATVAAKPDADNDAA